MDSSLELGRFFWLEVYAVIEPFVQRCGSNRLLAHSDVTKKIVQYLYSDTFRPPQATERLRYEESFLKRSQIRFSIMRSVASALSVTHYSALLVARRREIGCNFSEKAMHRRCYAEEGVFAESAMHLSYNHFQT